MPTSSPKIGAIFLPKIFDNSLPQGYFYIPDILFEQISFLKLDLNIGYNIVIIL
jgi:hypothetical protein